MVEPAKSAREISQGAFNGVIVLRKASPVLANFWLMHGGTCEMRFGASDFDYPSFDIRRVWIRQLDRKYRPIS